MTTDTALRCALGVSDRTLSDYRSAGLTPEHMKHLRTHVPQCPACQTRLDEFETMARALRAQPELDDHAQLWQNVRASIATTSMQTALRRNHRTRSHSAQWWTAFGSIAAVMALAVGFVAVFASHSSTPLVATKTATPQIIQSGNLTWKQVIVPKGFPGVDQSNESATNTSTTIAQSDGNTAYACQASKKQLPAPRVWATHDAGASWSIITPTGLAENIGGCRLWIDANDSRTLVVAFFPILGPQQPTLPDQWVNYASFDGGATWTKPAGLQDGMLTDVLASAHGKIYALRTTALPNAAERIYVSSDQMRSWTPIDDGLPEVAANQSMTQQAGKTFWIWVNSETGEALVETLAGALWTTTNDGARWTKLAYSNPFTLDNVPQISVAWTASSHFTICTTFLLGPNNMETRLTCTTDDGKSWQERPFLPGLTFISVGADGSLYALMDATFSNNGGDGNTAIYRLPPDGASIVDWQLLGTIPGSHNGYGYQATPAGNTTVFWTTWGISTTTSGGHTTTTIQPNTYVATYP